MLGPEVQQAAEPYMKAGESGTVVVVFSNNGLGMLYLDSGVPVSARFRTLEGVEALAAWQELTVQTVKFHQSTDIVRSKASLSTQDEAPQPAIDQAQVRIRGPRLTASQRQTLSVLLTDFIGPVAPLIMADVPAVVGLDTALGIVSKEIESPQQTREFLIEARNRLR